MSEPAKQTLRDEFEKAFRDLLGQDTDPMPDIKQAFTAGARWMAERIAEKAFDSESGVVGSIQICQMADELQ